MITEKKNKYKTPNVTVVAFTIEAGFAGTTGDPTNPTNAFVTEQSTDLEGYNLGNDLTTGYFN